MQWYSMDYDQTFRTSGKNLVKLAIPLIGTHLANVALGITDTIMMGWYSVPALAALDLGNAYFFVLFFIWRWILLCSPTPRCIFIKCWRVYTRETIFADGLMVVFNIRGFNFTIFFQCRENSYYAWASQ